MSKYKHCSDCGRYLPQSEFWKHKADDKILKNRFEREYLFHKCKECCQKTLDYNNLDSIFELLKAFDVPYIEHTWNEMFQKWGKQSVGRYLSLMRLFGYYQFDFNDSDFLNQCHQEYLSRWEQKGINKDE